MIIFLSVGFETTTSMIAVTAIEAKKEGIKNLLILLANKNIPPAMKALVKDEGNPEAVNYLQKVFRISDSWWRGIRNIPGSG